MFNLISHQRNAIKTVSRSHLTLVRMSAIKKTNSKAVEDEENKTTE